MRTPFRIVTSPVAAGLIVLYVAAFLGAQHIWPHGATVIVTNTNDNRPDPVTSSITGTSPTPTATPCTGSVVWSQNFDQLPAATPGQCFSVSNVAPDTSPNDLYQPDPDGLVICGYQFGNTIIVPNATSVFRFRNNFNTEVSDGTSGDGGVLEVASFNISGGEFLDITDPRVGATFVSGGYTGVLVGGFLDGRSAWVGDSGGYIDTVINLGPNLAGQPITFLFRFVSDEAVGAPGWRIDTMTLTDGVCPTPSPTGSPTPASSPTPARSVNLSTRILVQTGDNAGIGGFIITGTTPKQILARGIGPSLGLFGVPDPLADPIMALHGPAGFTPILNDNWRDTQEAEIKATGIPPTDDLESAILATLFPGNYTVVVQGNNNGTGVGLIEIFDLEPEPAVSQMANISTRAFAGTGTDVVIGGFILGAGNNADIVVRAIGPSLSGVGVPNPLADPTLELRDNNGALLFENDNCGSSPLPPTDPLESCIEASLSPGTYTTILAGKDGGTGVGLVEIYNLE